LPLKPDLRLAWVARLVAETAGGGRWSGAANIVLVTQPDKEGILREIARCAAENNGVPLGKRRFEAATDIRESDWSGRYWARWSDAIREAGFEPNALRERLLDDEGLLRCLALLTQQLGHYPTGPEMRMHHRSNPDFPNQSTFTLRLGKRSVQVELLAGYTSAHSEFADVYDICAPLLAREDIVFAPADTTRQSCGYLYLVRSGRYHKIGRSNHLGRRAYEIALQLPEKLQMVHSIETDDPVGIEQYWHERFADRRSNGEWFLLSSADVAAFKLRRRFM